MHILNLFLLIIVTNSFVYATYFVPEKLKVFQDNSPEKKGKDRTPEKKIELIDPIFPYDSSSEKENMYNQINTSSLHDLSLGTENMFDRSLSIVEKAQTKKRNLAPIQIDLVNEDEYSTVTTGDSISSEESVRKKKSDEAATGDVRVDQDQAFRKMPLRLSQAIDQNPIPSINVPKVFSQINEDDLKLILRNLNLIEYQDFQNIKIEEISANSHYVDKLYKVYIDVPNYIQNKFYCDISLEGNHSNTQKLLFIIKVYKTREVNIEILKSEIGIKIHEDLRQQDTIRYSKMPRLSFTEQIARVQFGDKARYLSIIHAAKGISLKEYVRNISDSRSDLENLMVKLGDALGTFHAYHALRTNAASFYSVIRNQILDIKQGQRNPLDTFSFHTITHGDLHVENIFINSVGMNPIFYFIDLESMFLFAIDLKENTGDILKIYNSIFELLEKEKAKGLFYFFDRAYNEAVLATLDQPRQNFLRNFVRR